MSTTEIEIKRCETCDGLGQVPVDPGVTQAELRYAILHRNDQGYAEFCERADRKLAERKAAEAAAREAG